MADKRTGAGAAAEESRLILLPVDLDDASVNAVSWAARHVLRKGAFPGQLVAAVGALAADPQVVAWLQRAHAGAALTVARRVAAVIAAPRA